MSALPVAEGYRAAIGCYDVGWTNQMLSLTTNQPEWSCFCDKDTFTSSQWKPVSKDSQPGDNSENRRVT